MVFPAFSAGLVAPQLAAPMPLAGRGLHSLTIIPVRWGREKKGEIKRIAENSVAAQSTDGRLQNCRTLPARPPPTSLVTEEGSS